MGIFYSAPQAVLPTVQAAIRSALVANPPANADAEASTRTLQVAQTATPTFNAWRFGGAVTISVLLLIGAILTESAHPDISKVLLTSFSSFSGIVLGLLGGEAQKSLT